MTNNPERVTLTIEEAGKLLGVSRRTAYEMAHLGQMPVLRLGHRRLMVPRAALEDMLANPPALKTAS